MAAAVNLEQTLAAVCARHGLTDVRPVGQGVEFSVYYARSSSFGDLAVRIPKQVVYSTPNVHVPSRELALQEWRIAGWLHERGFPVAEPIDIMSVDDQVTVLLSRFVESGEAPDMGVPIGATVARLHGHEAPDIVPVYQGHDVVEAAVTERAMRRYSIVRQRAGESHALPDITAEAYRSALMSGRTTRLSLLHMDLRLQNVLGVQGSVRALVDWSNALLGPPLAELSRLAEYADVAENQIAMDDVLAGYRATSSLPELDSVAGLAYRLDTAVMLALVFMSVQVDETEAASRLARVAEIAAQLADAGMAS